MPVKGKRPRKVRGKGSDSKGGKSNWRQPCYDYWSQMVASMDFIVHSLIQDDARTLCYLWLYEAPHSVHAQSSPKPRQRSGMTLRGQKKQSGRASHGRLKVYEASKGKKGKGKRSKSKGKSKGKGTPRSIVPRPSQSQTPRNDRAQPKAKPEARSCMTSDFLFAMMSKRSKPTWRHSRLEWHRLHALHSC